MHKILVPFVVLVAAWSPTTDARAALQNPPQCLLTDNPPCQGLGWNNTTKQWVKQAPTASTPPVTIQGAGAVTVTGGPPNPYVISAPIVTLQAGTNVTITGGPNPYIINAIASGGGGSGPGINPITFTGSFAPNTWYGLYDPLPASIVLPTPDSTTWTNASTSPGKSNTILCFSNYTTTATAVPISTASGVPFYGSSGSLQPGGADQCFAVDDKTPAGWRGTGG